MRSNHIKRVQLKPWSSSRAIGTFDIIVLIAMFVLTYIDVFVRKKAFVDVKAG